ncbi:hypothetical protein SMB34_07580 [Thalassospira permensis NBRC 106175]|uniref:Uncharacterized protein n=1 Tax=Thalassospira permensis NBRC 106175 TaxID=1353532 RepID=A0ABR4TJK9_9PROT|nr:hypothetical protein SMB34_07580 [Thalassospira permensis NBRC 106175]
MANNRITKPPTAPAAPWTPAYAGVTNGWKDLTYPKKTVIPANAGIQSAVPHTPHVMSIKPENFDTFFGYVDSIDIKSPLNHYVSIF